MYSSVSPRVGAGLRARRLLKSVLSPVTLLTTSTTTYSTQREGPVTIAPLAATLHGLVLRKRDTTTHLTLCTRQRLLRTRVAGLREPSRRARLEEWGELKARGGSPDGEDVLERATRGRWQGRRLRRQVYHRPPHFRL